MRKKSTQKHVTSVCFDKKTFRFSDGTQQKVEFLKKDFQKRLGFLLDIIHEDKVELSICFCDEETMQDYNFKFRNKNAPTDVLSFPPQFSHPQLLEPDAPRFFGDLLVCIPVCVKQAKRAKKTIAEELEKMIIHGIIHLKGFDHERGDADHFVMTTLEKALQKQLISYCGKPEWCTLTKK